MALGDPAFGPTFEAVRNALVDELVTGRAGKWWCLRCRERWEGEKRDKQPHAEGCVLSLPKLAPR